MNKKTWMIGGLILFLSGFAMCIGSEFNFIFAVSFTLYSSGILWLLNSIMEND